MRTPDTSQDWCLEVDPAFDPRQFIGKTGDEIISLDYDQSREQDRVAALQTSSPEAQFGEPARIDESEGGLK